MSTVLAAPSTMSSASSLPTIGACWKPWPLKPLARTSPGSSGARPEDRMAVGRHLVQADPAPGDRGVGQRRERPDGRRQEILGDEPLVDPGLERRPLGRVAHAHEDAARLAMEVEAGRRVDDERLAGRARRGTGAVTSTTRGIGSSGSSTPAVAASRPAHGPAASITVSVSIGPSVVSTRVKRSAVGHDRGRLDAGPQVGPGAAGDRGVAEGQPRRIGDPVRPGSTSHRSRRRRPARGRARRRPRGARRRTSTPRPRCISAAARNPAQAASPRTRNR